MRLLKSTILLTLLCPFISFGQYDTKRVMELINNGSESELVMESAIMIQEGYFYQAGMIVDKLLEFQPTSSNYNYRRGFIYLEMSTDFVKATPYLERAVLKTDKKYDPFNTKETAAPIDAYFEMGKCYHRSGNIDKAEEFFNKFLAASITKSNNVFFAKLYLEQCKVARAEMANPKNVYLKNMGNSVNTTNPEFSPVISLDGSALYYTSKRRWPTGASDKGLDPRNNQYPEDIYVSYRDFDSTWMDPIKLEFCDSLQNEATLAVSPDERRVYVYQDTKGNGDIFYSDFSTNKFQEVTHLEDKKINTNDWETHATVTPDGQKMYFVSNRNGGMGGRDIYYCTKQKDGSWGTPVNAGPNINGPMDEESPFVSIDNSTLYFSSNGNRSMGDFDIFMSTSDGKGQWGPSVNLGSPINSTCDDIFYTTTVDGLTGYMTSLRIDGKGEKDIYEIKNNYLGVKNIAVLNGKISVIGNRPLPEDVSVTLRCLNCDNPYDRKLFPRLRDGVFMNSLEPCKEYDLTFSYEKDGKKNFYSEKFKTECNKEYSEVYREFWLDLDKQMMVKPYYVAGTITDSKTKEKLSGVTISLTDKKTGDKLSRSLTKNNGAYKTDTLGGMKKGDNVEFALTLEKEGYLTMSYDAPVTLDDNSEIRIDGVLVKNEVGTDIGLNVNPIYFDYNRWDIRPDAAKELDKIVKIMKENPGIKIELGSHTDSRGKDESNIKLSDQRAKASARYIVSKGISANRITGKGYGETKLKISEAQIESMPSKEEKEKGHQLNRRTEFIIVK
ncbi:MAG: OmpA/MotB domain protein [Fluviicola sp.]|uniref:OmpA family protein n=1 Tax=Fluviicola sp. TaxID=1917219 RepID=UPI00262D3DFF|nr:OmpA family protein [Fluviicola sp.]MDF3028990.1 OmpA/MotB domain protein [Fluviicola sp.]